MSSFPIRLHRGIEAAGSGFRFATSDVWRVLYLYVFLFACCSTALRFFHSFVHSCGVQGTQYMHDMTRRDMKNGEFGGSELSKKQNEEACADSYVGIGRLTRARISEREAMPWMDG